MPAAIFSIQIPAQVPPSAPGYFSSSYDKELMSEAFSCSNSPQNAYILAISARVTTQIGYTTQLFVVTQYTPAKGGGDIPGRQAFPLIAACLSRNIPGAEGRAQC